MSYHPTLFLITFLTLLLPSQAIVCNYTRYISDFGKTYVDGSQEYLYHSLIYESNCTLINTHNNDPANTYTIKESNCTDLTEPECRSLFNLRPLDLSHVAKNAQPSPSLLVSTGSPAPSALDYRNYSGASFVTSVKNQLSCGCCWAFASIAAYESWLLLKGYNYGLSQEASLECTYLYAPNGRMSNCTSGYLVDAMNFLAKVGSVLRSNYPYISGSISSGSPASTPGICTQQNRIFLGNGSYFYINNYTNSQIQQLLFDKGPMMVGIYANTPFMQYSGGTFSGCPADASQYINHAVQLIGYDNSGNWIIKNQWATTWGQSGFMTLSSTYDCGISKAIVGIDFAAYSANPSMTFDPTVYQTVNATTKSEKNIYLVGILLLAGILLI